MDALRIFLTVMAAYGLFVLYLYIIQDKLLFLPFNGEFKNCEAMQELGAKPKTLGPIRYHFRENAAAKGIFFLFHGNGGSACDRIDYIIELQELPLHFVFVEYAGYAGDKTKPSEPLILKEALELVDHFQKMNLPIALFGESLGAAVATYVASERNISALLLQSPFPSIAEVAQHHYFYVPVKWLSKNPFRSSKWAPKVTAPTLIIAATNDEVVPFKFTVQQIENFKIKPQLVELGRTSHNFMSILHAKTYWGAIRKFLEAHLG